MKWVAIALALLLLASGLFWLGRSGAPPETANKAPARMPVATLVPDPAKTAVPSAVEAAPPPETHADAPAAAMDAVPPSEPAPPPVPPRPRTLAELDTPTLIQRAIRADDRCSNGQGSLDQTGRACAERDRAEAILNARGFCHTGGETDWQRCAQ